MADEPWLKQLNAAASLYNSYSEAEKLTAAHMLAMFWRVYLARQDSADEFKKCPEKEQIEYLDKIENQVASILNEHGNEASLGVHFFHLYLFGMIGYGEQAEEIFENICGPMLERGLPLASI